MAVFPSVVDGLPFPLLDLQAAGGRQEGKFRCLSDPKHCTVCSQEQMGVKAEEGQVTLSHCYNGLWSMRKVKASFHSAFQELILR